MAETRARDTADINKTVTDGLDLKANLASPTFTGTPAGPTAASGTNTTQLATTAFVQGASGLTLITAESFSAVSSVSINSCFTSTYNNYRITIAGTASSTANIQIRMRAAGTDATGSDYSSGSLFISTSATAFEAGNSAANIGLIGRWQSGGNAATSIDIFGPELAEDTRAVSDTGSNTSGYTFFFYHNSASAYDGFSIIAGAGNLTGIIRVYGYKN